MFFLWIPLLLCLHNPLFAAANQNTPIRNLSAKGPSYVIGEQFAELRIKALNEEEFIDSTIHGNYTLAINNEARVVEFQNGIAFYTLFIEETQSLKITYSETGAGITIRIRFLPPWFSLIPPLIAIVLALIFKEVIISLFISIFVGALILTGFHAGNILPAFLSVLDKYIMNALRDEKHLSLILFALMIGGMVVVISKSGGMTGIVSRLSKYARSARSVQLITFFLSLAIFYDNYSSSLIVGNTMRTITDKFKVSREKLAFIVHCTAASVTSIAFVTTWIGAELTYISDATAGLRIDESAYSIFLKSLQYAFYPILMLFFIFFLIIFKKDFGSMADAEVTARSAGIMNETEEMEKKDVEKEEDLRKILEPEKEGKNRWLNALIPVAAVIIVAFIALLVTGARNSYELIVQNGIRLKEYNFSDVWQHLDIVKADRESFFQKIGVLIGNSDFYIALLWSSFSGISFAILLSLLKKGMDIRQALDSMVQGFRLMLSAILILVFSWSLAEVIEELHTAEYLTGLFSGNINPRMMAFVTFLLAALFTFSTGSVWGTMAILYPLLLPVTWILTQTQELETAEAEMVFYSVVAAVLTGSVFGVHCSPISDTTILSSISSDCSHVAHVRTQLPYAMTVAGVSLGMLLFSMFGFHWIIDYGLALISIYLIVKYAGKRVE